jgi:hypothetical protein
MGNALDPTNRSALQFNIESAETMKQICKPILDQEIGIINFAYWRIYNNGTRLYLGDEPEWIAYYLKHGFQNNLEHMEFYAPGEDVKYALWDGFKDDPIHFAVRNVFNWWNGISIYEYAEDYVDCFVFKAHKNNVQIINYYLNHLDILNKKVQFFKESASQLIDPTDKGKFIASKNWAPFNEVARNPLLSPKKTKNFIQKINQRTKLD